jgi:hypothetical protein
VSEEDVVEAVLLKFVPFCGTEIHCGVEARLRWLTVDLEPCTFEMAMERFFWQRFWKTHSHQKIFSSKKIYQQFSVILYVNLGANKKITAEKLTTSLHCTEGASLRDAGKENNAWSWCRLASWSAFFPMS